MSGSLDCLPSILAAAGRDLIEVQPSHSSHAEAHVSDAIVAKGELEDLLKELTRGDRAIRVRTRGAFVKLAYHP